MERGLLLRLWPYLFVVLLAGPCIRQSHAALTCTTENLGNTSSLYTSNPQNNICVTLRWPEVRNDQLLVINYASAFTFPRGSGKLQFPDGSIWVPQILKWDSSIPGWSGAYFNSNTSQCNSTEGLLFHSDRPATVSASQKWPPMLNFTLNHASLQLAYYVKTCDAQPSTLAPTTASEWHSKDVMHGERIKTIIIASTLAAGNVFLIVVLLYRVCSQSNKKHQQLPSVSVAHRRGTTPDLNYTNVYHIVEDAYTLADQSQQHHGTVSNPIYITAIN